MQSIFSEGRKGQDQMCGIKVRYTGQEQSQIQSARSEVRFQDDQEQDCRTGGEEWLRVWAENKAEGQELPTTGCWPAGLGRGHLFAGAGRALGWSGAGGKSGVSIAPLH